MGKPRVYVKDFADFSLVIDITLGINIHFGSQGKGVPAWGKGSISVWLSGGAVGRCRPQPVG